MVEALNAVALTVTGHVIVQTQAQIQRVREELEYRPEERADDASDDPKPNRETVAASDETASDGANPNGHDGSGGDQSPRRGNTVNIAA